MPVTLYLSQRFRIREQTVQLLCNSSGQWSFACSVVRLLLATDVVLQVICLLCPQSFIEIKNIEIRFIS